MKPPCAGRGKDSGGRHRGSGGIPQSSPSAGKVGAPGFMLQKPSDPKEVLVFSPVALRTRT